MDGQANNDSNPAPSWSFFARPTRNLIDIEDVGH
jgi:hypothetical protein